MGAADKVVIGRGAMRSSCRELEGDARALTITVPDPRMSSKHARLTRDGKRWLLEDAGSRNGTRVNTRAATAPVPLADGDIVEMGQTLFLVRADLPVPSGAPADLDSGSFDQDTALSTLDPGLTREVARLNRIARSRVPVVLGGETGTGKELTARAIHRLSGRKGPFVAVNCGALSASLLEATLFGHVRGAFTGAVSESPGLLRSAHGGTLFLDEIGDLPMASQVALLRVIEEGEVLPVGGLRTAKVDLRIVAATHRSLEDAVERGAFRADLYARLAGFTFVVPPLRTRRQDMGLLLAAMYGDRSLHLTVDAAYAVVRHDWPLNVRELRNALESAAALCEGAIGLEHLPRAVAEAAGRAPIGADPVQEGLLSALARHRGNISAVARDMGKARMQIQRWLRRYGIDPRAFRR
jgi:transcriptional regulator with PAS, ATPase and Fis domain